MDDHGTQCTYHLLNLKFAHRWFVDLMVQSSLRTGPPPLKFRYLGSQVMGHSWTCSFLSLCLAAQSKISQAELETDLSGQEGMSCLGLGDKMLVDGVTRTKTTAGCETPRVPGFWLNPHSLSFPVHAYFLSYLLHCTQYCTVTSMRISVFLLRVDADILLSKEVGKQYFRVTNDFYLVQLTMMKGGRSQNNT